MSKTLSNRLAKKLKFATKNARVEPKNAAMAHTLKVIIAVSFIYLGNKYVKKCPKSPRSLLNILLKTTITLKNIARAKPPAIKTKLLSKADFIVD